MEGALELAAVDMVRSGVKSRRRLLVLSLPAQAQLLVHDVQVWRKNKLVLWLLRAPIDSYSYRPLEERCSRKTVTQIETSGCWRVASFSRIKEPGKLNCASEIIELSISFP